MRSSPASVFLFILATSTDQFHITVLRFPRSRKFGRHALTRRPLSMRTSFSFTPLLVFLFHFSKLLGPQSKRLEHFVLVLRSQHLRGLFRRPGRSKTLRPVGNPVSRQRHQRGVLRQHVRIHRFQRVGRRVVCVFVIR